jgi:hypothetical protein
MPTRLQPALEATQPAQKHPHPHPPHCLRTHACAVCQLGGLIYFTLLFIIVLILINFLPLVNFVFQLLFDGCVACVDSIGTKEGRTKLKQNAKAAKAGIGAARSAAKGVVSQAKGGGNPKAPFGANFFKASAGSGNAAFNSDNVHLTAQQVRSLKRARRAQRLEMSATGAAATGASFGQRIRRMGSQLVNMGAPPSQEGQGLLKSQRDGISPPSSPPSSPPPAPEVWA